jgi:hypothetical protein
METNDHDINYLVAPAEGERRAIGGYYPQYRVSAYLILVALRDGSLQWIRVADPEAGRVDDLQIGTQARVDAFQVKWSRYGGTFTFNDMTTSSGNAPCLIRQLAEGWSKIKDAYPKHRVVVHLITKQMPSTSASIPIGDKTPTPKHFAAFLEQAWKLKRGQSIVAIPEPWLPALEEFRRASGLSQTDFDDFARDCELEFGWRLPYEDKEDILTPDQEIVREDIEHLTEMLFSTVAHPSRVIQIDRAQLLSRLGWADRFKFRSRHEFPVDELTYEPIEDTIHQLENALDSLPGGYIILLGTPGSGKSTLLTQTFRLRQERVIRYYGYVPDAQGPMSLRGESVNFLHDVVLSLEEQGFHVGESPSRFDRSQLLERFYKQIQLLNDDWRVNRHKTVILIDGLDHIEREQHPVQSLLHDLPLPEQVPDGVYFVLGSQTDSYLPGQIQAVVREPQRRVEMALLGREAVVRIVERAKPSLLVPEDKESIYILSGGHPLALAYILNIIRNITDKQKLTDALKGIVRYEGNIEYQYHSYWKQIEKNAELVHLLGLLARIRGVITLSWVETWAKHDVVDTLRRTLFQYFRREDGDRWYFFHNSFRLDVVQKTAESVPGVSDERINRQFHHELAEICAKAPSNSPWSWEQLYHRLLAGEHDVVLKLATREWFHSQWLACRPIEAIQADIRLALNSVSAVQDPVALTRIMLIGTEISQRSSYLESTSIIKLLLKIGENQIAAQNIRDGNRLRINTTSALRFCREMKNAGMIEESRRVFELAEPLDLLTTPIEDDPQDEKGDMLQEWATTAVHFRDLDRIIKTILAVRKATGRDKTVDPQKLSVALQNRMLFYAGHELVDLERWEDLSKVMNTFKVDDRDTLDWWFWLQIAASRYCSTKGDTPRAQQFLKNILDVADTNSLDSEAQVGLAECLYRISDEKEAEKRFRTIAPPTLQTEVFYSGRGLQPFLHRFRYSRLLYTFGELQSPSVIIPDPANPRHIGLVYLERALCTLAHIWAESWRGHPMRSTSIMLEISPLLRLFNRNWRETREWTSWHVAESSRSEFYKLLVDTIAQHGSEAVEMLSTTFEKEWNDHDTSSFWPLGVRREIVLALYQAGIDRTWCVNWLQSIQKAMLNETDVSGRVEECIKQAEAWVALDERESARQTLKQALQVSFGIGYRKDYQIDTWIEWLGRVNRVETELIAERISWFAKAIISMKEETEGAASTSAANKLLEITFDWSPRKALSLFCWFLDRGVISHEESVRVLLRKAMETPDPPTGLVLHTLVDFLLPISTTVDDDLAELIIEKIASKQGDEKAVEEGRYFLSKLNVYALPTTRAQWRCGIVRGIRKLGYDLKDVGLKPVDIKIEGEQNGPIPTLKLNNGSVLTIDEIESAIHTVSDLAELITKESHESYFSWEKIIAKILRSSDEKDANQIAALFRSKHHASQIISLVSERLNELGKPDAAWLLGMEALNTSSPYGWSRWYDGGSRIAAFEALNRADPKRACSLVYETLVRDLTTEIRYPGETVLNLHAILPLITHDLPLHDIWIEIDGYIRHMFETSPLSPDEPTQIRGAVIEDTTSRAIADLLSMHINNPVSLVSLTAQRASANLLLLGNEDIQNALCDLLSKNESCQESVLIVLDAVSSKKSKLAANVQEVLERLSSSTNYAVRYISQKILHSIDGRPYELTGLAAPLPAIYRLLLPPARTTRGLETISEGEPLPDSEDPALIVRPFDFQLEAIAEEAKFAKINVFYHAVQIMRQLEPERSWSAEGERRLRSNLDSIGLRLPYHRPRAVLARRSVFHIVTELAEAKALDVVSLQKLEPVLRYYDPEFVLVEPSPRPSNVHSIAVGIQTSRREEEWLEETDNQLSTLFFKSGDTVILAERTMLRQLDWEKPTEARQSIISTFPPSNISNFNQLARRVTNKLMSEYGELKVDDKINVLIIQNVTYGFDSSGSDWLALNPFIGHRLGWQLSKEGLFRWVDVVGNTMVESLWWLDGQVEQSPPHLNNEVGEGWLVVASQSAWNLIKAKHGVLRQIAKIERNIWRDDNKLQRQAYAERIVS